MTSPHPQPNAEPQPSPLLTSPADLYYETYELTEDILGYAPGGYHPVVIGDIISSSSSRDDPSKVDVESESKSKEPRRYRIMHKLGWGAYATVWLAERLRRGDDGVEAHAGWVALKINVAVGEHWPDRPVDYESAMLRAVQAPFRSKNFEDSESNVVKLEDAFTIHGPNGTHEVLVCEVVVPMGELLRYERSPGWKKAAARGLVRGVAQMHRAGVVHGDLHIGNIALSFPPLSSPSPSPALDPEDVLTSLPHHEMTLVLPRLPMAPHRAASLPPYVVAPVSFVAHYNYDAAWRAERGEEEGEGEGEVRIVDFGTAHYAGTLPSHFVCSKQSISPEAVFALRMQKIDNPPVEPPADIWGLGTAIYQIVAGYALFDDVDIPSLPFYMLQMAGRSPSLLPPYWAAWLPRAGYPIDVSEESAERWWAERRENLRGGCRDDEDAEALVRLLRRVLVLEPGERPSAEEVLEDEWFKMGEGEVGLGERRRRVGSAGAGPDMWFRHKLYGTSWQTSFAS
ncbi:hypothetical protein CVT26_000675 [Gymnopilus dilepis]|uniref:non-specific serine/threonine protein kinase n=1 Tax=Gymnopilus dilepis TaxID=231916 RepID=A0A409WL68_9AGAR|nr:hypothetical protein CVT26_000675 [Gymnopilus dilepis]